jgi:hypothetical protein
MDRNDVLLFLQTFDLADRQKSRQLPEVVAQLQEEAGLCYGLMSAQNKLRMDGLINAIDESLKLFNWILRKSR